MKRIIFGVFVSLLFVAAVSAFFMNRAQDRRFMTTGLGNDGKIVVYDTSMKKVREIDTGYRFVHTVRTGTVNGQKMIVAGVSNSFFAQPYGCAVIYYSIPGFKKNVLDAVGDLRCKDLTFGDADNDGKNEIIVGTHGQGIVRMYKLQGNSWKKENLEFNYIAQIDREKGSNHQVPYEELTCGRCEIHTAVHIVKIADADNDGKNEVIVTMSSPLELKNVEEISYIRIYKKTGASWTGTTVDGIRDREFRSISIGDVYHTGKNVLVVGIGSPRNEKGSLFSYRFDNGRWDKKLIYNETEEKNMKGTAIADLRGDGKNQILLATGFPKAKVMILEWDGKSFAVQPINTVASLIKAPEGEHNAMAVTILQSPTRFVVSGMTTFPKQNIGWEGTSKGFTVLYEMVNGKWVTRIVDDRSVLALD